jgi:ADP-ribose pyrophosphatase
MPTEETILDTQTIFEGRVVALDVATVRLPSGRTAKRELIRHGGAEAVVPLDDEGNVLMVRQFRLAVNESLLEIPAGGLDAPDEDPRDCAAREMQEEVGYRPGELVSLGKFYVTPGYSSEVIHLFLGLKLEPASLPADDDEYIKIERLPFDQLVEMAYDGRLLDSKTIIALLRAERYLSNTNR